jgi:hypothetical protein
MSKHIRRSAIVAIAALAFAAPLLAQGRSTVTGTELDAAIGTQATGNREKIRELLGTEEAGKLAKGMGVSASEVSARVATLDEATLDQLADRSGLHEQVLAGGADRIVISTTAVIIILLILILLT